MIRYIQFVPGLWLDFNLPCSTSCLCPTCWNICVGDKFMMNELEQVPLVKFIERPKCHKMLLNEVQCFPISNFQEFPSAGSIFMRKFFLSSHFSHQVSFIHRKPSHIRRGPFVTSRCQSDLSDLLMD